MTVYNKLVRDLIPQIIEDDGKSCSTRILDDEEYHTALLEKVDEELQELREAPPSKRFEELADIVEVIQALGQFYGTNTSELEKIREQKRIRRGGFDNRIYLIEVED